MTELFVMPKISGEVLLLYMPFQFLGIFLFSAYEAAGVHQILDKEVYGVEVTRSGTGPQPPVVGSNDAAGISTGLSPVTYSVKYRKCGRGVTKS